MNIFLCGQKFFGQKVLEMLTARGETVVGVAAPPGDDRLWKKAAAYNIPTLIPGGTLRADTLPDGVDLIIAAHSYDFISAKTIAKTSLGGIGYHPSLLPLHRGRDAIRWTLRNADPVTGGSVYWLTNSVDGGPIAAQDWCFVPRDASETDLWRDTLQPMGLRLIGKVLDDLHRGEIVAVPQDESIATWEPSLSQQPIFRPDLAQIGPPPIGYRVTAKKTLATNADVICGDWKKIAGG